MANLHREGVITLNGLAPVLQGASQLNQQQLQHPISASERLSTESVGYH